MTDPPPDHRAPAVALFNATWDHLDNPDRSKADDLDMLSGALGSRYHWRRAGTPRNFAISEWQVSRVFAMLGDGAWAARFGQASLDLCDDHDLDPFVRAYAYEALARAAAVSGDRDAAAAHLVRARATADCIEEGDDRDALLADLETV